MRLALLLLAACSAPPRWHDARVAELTRHMLELMNGQTIMAQGLAAELSLWRNVSGYRVAVAEILVQYQRCHGEAIARLLYREGK